MEYKFISEIQHDNRFGIVVPVHFDSIKSNSAKFFPTEEIFREINHFIFQNGNPDYIWLRIPNNPYLFYGIKFLIKLIKKYHLNQKIGAYINCSLICNEKIQKDLFDLDFIAVNINSIEPSNFLKVNPCCVDISLDELLEGTMRFKKNYKGHLGIYTMFFNGVNDNIDNINSLKRFLLKIMPDYISIGDYTDKGYNPISNEFKEILEACFRDAPYDVIFTF